MTKKFLHWLTNITLQLKTISVFLFGVVIILLGVFLKPHNLVSQHLPSKIHTPYAVPEKIEISRIGIVSNITGGGIENKNWILSDNSILYLPTSGRINEGYNTILYGHKRSNLFLNLDKITTQDNIVITDSRGIQSKYRVYLVQIIQPSDTQKLYATIPNTLTLFTCDGWYDEHRLLVQAKLST